VHEDFLASDAQLDSRNSSGKPVAGNPLGEHHQMSDRAEVAVENALRSRDGSTETVAMWRTAIDVSI
jgi:hypothetical protein